MKGAAQLFSSAKTGGTDNWGTPQAFYDVLNEEFGFELDPCANAENAKAPYFSIDEGVDGLEQDWKGQTAFVNFPYSQANEWADKCISEASKRTTEPMWQSIGAATSTSDSCVVVLCAARTDAKWWQSLAAVADEVRFIKGRLAFVGPDGAGQSATFPSSVIVLRPGLFKNMEIVKEVVGRARKEREREYETRFTLWELPSEVRRGVA